MNKNLVLAIGLFLLGGISHSHGDGFIVVERPIYVPPTHFPFAPLEVSSHHVNVTIDAQVAVTSIDQEFYNPNDQRLEGYYMFPVPKGAHIDKFSMEIGGKSVDAELLPADKARGIYEDIVRKMRDPALLEYAGRDLFKVRIFPIEPRSRKPIKISYTELLRSDAGTVTYLYPLSTEKFSARPIKNLSLKIELKSVEPLAAIIAGGGVHAPTVADVVADDDVEVDRGAAGFGAVGDRLQCADLFEQRAVRLAGSGEGRRQRLAVRRPLVTRGADRRPQGPARELQGG